MSRQDAVATLAGIFGFLAIEGAGFWLYDHRWRGPGIVIIVGGLVIEAMLAAVAYAVYCLFVPGDSGDRL